jgi:NAD(P)-dependent dehydrogenase (short-subunit alcohol dehydrogenase family)
MAAAGLFALSGRVAVVTGVSAGGLGHHSALALAELEVDVWVLDVPGNEKLLDETIDAVRGDEKVAVHKGFCDVTDAEQVDVAFAEVDAASGRLDILVNHAGVMLRKAALETTLEERRA